MKKAFEVIVKGNVQKSAFRRFVKQLAKKHALFGSVENLDNYDEDVKIICEGEEKNLQAFLDRLKNQTAKDKEETTAIISRVEIKEIPFSGKFDNFKIMRGPEEVAERLDEGLVIMNRGFNSLEEKIENGFNSLEGKTEKGFNKMDENFKSLGDKIEHGFDKTDSNFKSLGDKIDSGFNRLDVNFKSLEGKTEKGFNKMDENFKSLDGKYGSVTKILTRINGNIEKLVGKA